jgi:hypothetical protein
MGDLPLEYFAAKPGLKHPLRWLPMACFFLGFLSQAVGLFVWKSGLVYGDVRDHKLSTEIHWGGTIVWYIGAFIGMLLFRHVRSLMLRLFTILNIVCMLTFTYLLGSLPY